MANSDEKMEFEDKFLKIVKKRENKKTDVYSVWSKCGNFELGEIKWYPSWRHYCFVIELSKIPLMTRSLIFSDRCQINTGEFTLKLNEEHRKRRLTKKTFLGK